MKPFQPICCLLSLTMSLVSLCARPQGGQPNIVLLVADDLGYGELGCQGNPQIPTPNIDSIAKEGVRFTNGYVTAAYCSASRAGLLTGRIQTRFGYEFNPVGAYNEDPAAGLPPGEKTLGDVLRDAGYTTGLIGKWHLGGTAKYFPQRRGFDEFYGFLHEGHYYLPPPWTGTTSMLRRKTLPAGVPGERWISDNGKIIQSSHMGHHEPDYDANNPIYRGGTPVEEAEYLTDALTRESVAFITRNKDRPFFLYLAYNAVHSPLQGADPYMEKFAGIDDIHRRIFAAMLGNLDDSVGQVLSTLKAAGLDENTVIFFISDNGGPTRELTSSNLPLRGGKGQVYEGGIRVPFLARWTGKIPVGKTYHHPVVSLDVFSTAAALANAPLPPGRKIDGVNLMPYLTGQKAESARPHDVLFWRSGNNKALRKGDWKLVKNSGRHRGATWQLYDLGEDTSEQRDLASSMPGKLAELQSIWNQWNAGMIDPVWSPPGK